MLWCNMVKIDQIELPDFPLLLAPMEDVSDPPFRAVCKDNGSDHHPHHFERARGAVGDAQITGDDAQPGPG